MTAFGPKKALALECSVFQKDASAILEILPPRKPLSSPSTLPPTSNNVSLTLRIASDPAIYYDDGHEPKSKKEFCESQRNGCYGYRYAWNVGSFGPDAGQVAMRMIRDNPQQFFSFPIKGARGERTIQKGHTYDLSPIPLFWDKVTVVRESETSFTFTTHPGHPEGFPAEVTFSTQVDAKGRLIFMVSAWGPNGRTGRFWNPARVAASFTKWTSMRINVERGMRQRQARFV